MSLHLVAIFSIQSSKTRSLFLIERIASSSTGTREISLCSEFSTRICSGLPTSLPSTQSELRRNIHPIIKMPGKRRFDEVSGAGEEQSGKKQRKYQDPHARDKRLSIPQASPRVETMTRWCRMRAWPLFRKTLHNRKLPGRGGASMSLRTATVTPTTQASQRSSKRALVCASSTDARNCV